MMPKSRKGVCSMWHDALHSRVPAAAGASGHYGSCQLKSKNLCPYPVRDSDLAGRLCCDVKKIKPTQRDMNDVLTFVSSHVHPGECGASAPHLHSGSLVRTPHLDSCPRKQGLTSSCSKGISSHSPMALTHAFCI